MSLLETVWLPFVVLGTVALLVAGTLVLLRMARRHADVVPAARPKAVAALILGLLLGAGGFLAVHKFEEGGHKGIHATFTQNLNKTIGESDWLEAGKTVNSKNKTIEVTLPPLIATAQHAVEAAPEGSPQRTSAQANLTALQDALTLAKTDRGNAEATIRKLSGNHLLWLKVEPLLRDHKDAEAHELIEKSLDAATVHEVLPIGPEGACARDAKTGECTTPIQPAALAHGFKDSHQVDMTMAQGFEAAYHHKAEFTEQMESQMAWLFYPSLTGLVMAPFAFMGGHFLARAFVPSDSVGYKKYPGASAGFFLLLGGFAVLAIPFSAWVLRDLSRRSAEGQISL